MTTQRDLERMLKYWQRKLRLTDWKITIKFATLEELDGDQGKNTYLIEAKTSEILVLNPHEYKPEEYPGKQPQDVENTVVHELLHLHLAPWKTRNAAEEVQMEQAIESMADAFRSFKQRRKNAVTLAG